MRSNIKKSKMLDIQISLNANILERVCSYKYVGLILDEHLNYNKHMTEMTKLISHKLFLLSKIRRYITEDACINIFKTMVLSVIEYCDIIYAGTTQANITKIDNLFYRGLQICINCNFSHLVNYFVVNVRLHPYVTEETPTCYYLCINRPIKSICLKRKQ